jgi:hypothetical protein
MILYLKDPKNSTRKLLDNINSFSNVAGYKINLQKSLAFGKKWAVMFPWDILSRVVFCAAWSGEEYKAVYRDVSMFRTVQRTLDKCLSLCVSLHQATNLLGFPGIKFIRNPNATMILSFASFPSPFMFPPLLTVVLVLRLS